MTTASDSADKAHVAAGAASSEAHDHQHRDVSGGWLRPAVFGAMDGLVTNVALIAGVGGGGGSPHALLLAGLAGLSAGAFSMAAGEFVSVSSQNELVAAEVRKEQFELEHHPESERQELAAMFRQRGVEAGLADEVARQVSVHPDQALLVHVREELGVDHKDLPSPILAAAASLVTFAIGALVPLFPYLIGFHSLAAAAGPGRRGRVHRRRPGLADHRPPVPVRGAAPVAAGRGGRGPHLRGRKPGGRRRLLTPLTAMRRPRPSPEKP